MKSVLWLLSISPDKHQSIFTKGCTLLYVLATGPMPFQAVRSPKVVEELKGLHRLMVRRQTVAAKNKRLPKQPKVLSATQRPATVPDWAMRPGQPREFGEPLLAITTLLATLEHNKEEQEVART
ncbi:hypothetical protein E2C01_047293 [Portunus trituberculatus]|nr:hypothetical protein [Portunus trituberculatus]